MCFRKKIEVFHNKTGQSEIQVLYKILIKNWFYPSMWIYNMFPRWISYLSIIQTKNVNETNKAFKNGTEAKMYVNTSWLCENKAGRESNLIANVYYWSTEWNGSYNYRLRKNTN